MLVNFVSQTMTTGQPTLPLHSFLKSSPAILTKVTYKNRQTNELNDFKVNN